MIRCMRAVSYTHLGFNGTYNGVLLGDGLGDVITALQAADRAQKLEAAV